MTESIIYITKKDVSNEENRKELLNKIYSFCLKQLQEYRRTAKNIDISEFPDGTLGLNIENDLMTMETLFRYDFKLNWDRIETQAEQEAKEISNYDKEEALKDNIEAEFNLEWDYILKDELTEFFDKWLKEEE